MEFNHYQELLLIEAESAIENLEKNLSKINVGTANPQLFTSLKIMYYDSPTPLGDIASISHPEPQQLVIKPFDKSIVKDINEVIVKQNYNVTVQDEGDKLRIIFPMLTTERRKESVKNLSSVKEQAKIKIRNARQDVLKKIKSDEELSEDLERQYQNEVQKIVDDYSKKIDQIIKTKEEQLMKI